MTKVQKSQYDWTVNQLRKACQSLKWKFKLEPDVDNRYDLKDEYIGLGVGFSIDGFEYFISEIVRPIGELEKFYFAAIIVQDHGSHDEPPSEDYKEITKKEHRYSCPYDTIGSILSAHWSTRYQMTMESLMDDDDEYERQRLTEERDV